MSLKKTFIYFIGLIVLSACNSSTDNEKNNNVSNADSIVKIVVQKKYSYNFNYGDKPGVAGIYEVPEMLSLCILDSARLKDMPKKVERAYHVLQDELAFLKIDTFLVAGQIIYSNDTSNFKFECFQLLDKMPTVQPQQTKIVMLEAEKMLVYNYFGSYQQLPSAYLNMLNHLKTNQLKQAGPFREYYVTDPTSEPDSKKWLTVIMLPVREK